MFFYIGKHCNLKGLNKTPYDLFLDQGWTKYESIYYKGYSTDCNIKDHIIDIAYKNYRPRGKWCVIVDGNTIIHPVLRGFPVYRLENGDLTNIKFDNSSMVFCEEILPPNTDENISLEQASDMIHEVLKENIVNFYKYNQVDRLNVYYTMGLDSMTVWSILDTITTEYNLRIHVPKPSDQSYEQLMGVKRDYTSELIDNVSNKYWGYRHLSVFDHTYYNLTGYYSERFQFREVTNGHAIAKFFSKELHHMVKSNEYLYYFLQRPQNKINTCNVNFKTEKEVKDHCFKSIFYDYQMWHLDNHITVSPFFDIRIPEICYKLSLEDICKNATNGTIQKNIINKINPEFLSILSDYKNERQIYKNFKKNFSKIKLNQSISINIT